MARQKYEAAKRWCEAVTNWGQMGRWEFRDCPHITRVPSILGEVSGLQVPMPV